MLVFIVLNVAMFSDRSVTTAAGSEVTTWTRHGDASTEKMEQDTDRGVWNLMHAVTSSAPQWTAPVNLQAPQRVMGALFCI